MKYKNQLLGMNGDTRKRRVAGWSDEEQLAGEDLRVDPGARTTEIFSILLTGLPVYCSIKARGR
jgi:hypothetical protein